MAGTVTTAHSQVGNIRTLVFTAVADAADGSFPTVVLPSIEGRILSLATDPGATAPTDNYDVAITDQYGHNVLQGLGADRDTTNTEKVPIVYSGTSLHPAVDESDTLTLAITGNSVNSATTVITLVYALGG